MTPKEEKELAEFALNFLGYEVKHGATGDYFYCRKLMEGGHSYKTTSIFEDLSIAPAIAHLAKREMEKQGFVYKHDWDGQNHTYLIMKPVDNKIDEWEYSNNVWEGFHPKDYKALWLAIREAIKEEG